MKTLGFRSLQALLAVSAVVVLTGAKGNGCGGEVVVAPEEPAPACAAGWHRGTVCSTDPDQPVAVDGSNSDPSIGAAQPPSKQCHDECVPDSGCPNGMAPQYVCSGGCYGGAEPGGIGGAGGGGGGWTTTTGTFPGTGGAGGWTTTSTVSGSTGWGGAGAGGAGGWTTTDPGWGGAGGWTGTDPGWGGAGGWTGTDPGWGCGDEPPTCQMQCVPAACPSGSHIEWSCGDIAVSGGGVDYGSGGATTATGPTDPAPPSDCSMYCAEDSDCGPGYVGETICEAEACAPGEDCPPSEPTCWTDCTPINGGGSGGSVPPSDGQPL